MEVPGRDLSPRSAGSSCVHALMQLTREHRVVIVGAYYRGLSVTELAQELGVPRATVRSRMYHGLCALQLALEESGLEPQGRRPDFDSL